MNYSRVTASSMRGAGERRGEGEDAGGAQAPTQQWLMAQCAQLPVARAGLVLQAVGRGMVPVALWPDAAGAGLLLELTERAGRDAKGLITGLPATDAESPNYGIAYPVRQNDTVLAVAALAVRVSGDEALQGVMRQLPGRRGAGADPDAAFLAGRTRADPDPRRQYRPALDRAGGAALRRRRDGLRHRSFHPAGRGPGQPGAAEGRRMQGAAHVALQPIRQADESGAADRGGDGRGGGPAPAGRDPGGRRPRGHSTGA